MHLYATPEKIAEVLIVSQFYWPEPIGTPLYVTDLARWLAKRDTRVTVLTERPYYPEFQLAAGYEDGQRDKETQDAVTILRVPTYIPRGGGVVARLTNESLYFARAMGRLVKREVPRATRVVSFCPSILAVLAGQLATRGGGRHVAVVFDIQSGLAAGLGMVRAGFLLRVMRGAETLVLNRVHHIVVLSQEMESALRRQGVRRPITVLPIWVDTRKIHPLPLRRSGSPVVLYSGNLGRKQGLSQVLAMAEVLKTLRPDARVVLRGAGSRFDAVRREIAERQLYNVALKPLVPAHKLNQSLADGDVHLVPQNPDTADFAVPSKVYNIMAAGRPFVTTADPGSALYRLQEQTSAFVCAPPNDPKAFAEAVANLLQDQKRRTTMGARARRYVEEQVARNAVLSRYAALIA